MKIKLNPTRKLTGGSWLEFIMVIVIGVLCFISGMGFGVTVLHHNAIKNNVGHYVITDTNTGDISFELIVSTNKY
jgi:hypothetical protein